MWNPIRLSNRSQTVVSPCKPFPDFHNWERVLKVKLFVDEFKLILAGAVMFKLIKETPITISIAIATIIAYLVPSAPGILEIDTAASLLRQIPQVFGCHLLHFSFEKLPDDLRWIIRRPC